MGPFGNNSALNQLSSKAPKPTLVRRNVAVNSSSDVRPSPNPTVVPAKPPITSKPKTVNGHAPRPSAAVQSSKGAGRPVKGPVRQLKSARIRRSSPATPPPPRFTDSDEDSDVEQPTKRQKVAQTGSIDRTRRIRETRVFSLRDEEMKGMVHAADIANVGTLENPNDKYNPYFTVLRVEEPENPTVELQYPNSSEGERYQLVRPKDRTDFNPVDEIAETMKIVAQHYLNSTQADQILNEVGGMIQALKHTTNPSGMKRVGSQTEFITIVTEYNTVITSLRNDGSLVRALDDMQTVSLPLIKHILFGQIYARTVSPQVKLLREYENGTDNVYGELLPGFLSRIFKETQLKSNQVFLDLGSGVGNCVLQAALEIGCESWGCEMMANPCKLASLQAREFSARCRLWGLKPGAVHLIEDNFLTNRKIDDILKRADVVLINNQAFTPQLNNDLTLKFLDMKEGCQIVSLKSFVPHDHKIKTTNINMTINLLDVTEKNRWSNEVSWSDVHGKWYVHRKDSTKLKRFIKERGL